MPAIRDHLDHSALLRGGYEAQAPLHLRALRWLMEHDRRHREALKLRGMPDERLRDMGLTRAQADSLR